MPVTDGDRIITVDGPIRPDDLGVTLPHEHVFFDATETMFAEPDAAAERSLAHEPVSLENRAWVRRNPSMNRDNLRMDSTETVVEELRAFARAGGDALVDVTPFGIGAAPERVRTVATRTGLTIVQGTGYYIEQAQPSSLATRSVDDIASEFVRAVSSGIGDTDVRAGIIGEIGLSGRIHPTEETVLRAGARAAAETGVALTIHPPGKTPYSQRDRAYPTSRWGLEILDIVEEEGLAPDRVVIGHVDRSLFDDLAFQKRLAERGAYVEYDLFGHQHYLLDIEDGYPSDVQRVDWIRDLIDAGHAERILLSQDVAAKTTRTTYGGVGYAHVLETVVPMMRHRGIDDERISTLLRENPRRLLTVAE